MPTPATEPGPADGPRLSLEIFDDEDWVGTLEVGFHQDHLGSCWWWRVSNGASRLLDSADNLLVTGPQTPREAMRVLLLFLLAAGDGPITSFNETAIEWARMHHKPLAKALTEI